MKVVKFDKIKCKEQTPYMPNIPDIPKCPENLKPQKQWEENFLAEFLEMRQVNTPFDNMISVLKFTRIFYENDGSGKPFVHNF